MAITYISSVLIILAVFLIWIAVQELARSYARKHPKFGPAREEGGGCGFLCFCKNAKNCPKNRIKSLIEKASLNNSNSQ